MTKQNNILGSGTFTIIEQLAQFFRPEEYSIDSHNIE